MFFFSIFFSGCINKNLEKKIEFGKDSYFCENCKMNIVDKRYRCLIINNKIKKFRFDDISCLIEWYGKKKIESKNLWVTNFNNNDDILNFENAFFVKSINLLTPMNSNIASFNDIESAKKFIIDNDGEIIDYLNVLNIKTSCCDIDH